MWHFRCESDQCVKYPIQPDTIDPMGLVRCRHTCGVGHRGLGVDIWPQLTGHISIRDHDDVINFQPIALENLNFRHQNARSDGEFWTINSARFMSQCNAKRASYSQKFNHQKNNVNLASVVINTIVESNDTRLRIGVDETYRINVSSPNNNNTITITIDATTIFGARHAMETLTQLIIYDDIRDVFLMRYNVQLEDGPTYSHRGISLDTSRNFYPLIAIQRTIGEYNIEDKLKLSFNPFFNRRNGNGQVERFPLAHHGLAQFSRRHPIPSVPPSLRRICPGQSLHRRRHPVNRTVRILSWRSCDSRIRCSCARR